MSPGGSPADMPSQFNGGYAWMLDLAKKAQTVGVIKGILFHQGETNTNDQNWKYKVQGIVADLKKDLGLGDIPFLAGELLYKSNGGPEQGCCSSHNTEINKLPGIIPNAHVIPANGLKGQDVAHFTTAAYREFGIRYATKMLELVSSTTTCTPTPIDAYSQLNAGDWLQVGDVTICVDDQVNFGPHPIETTGWSWTGPNGFTATTREISLNALTQNQAGKYTVKYTNAQKCTSSLDFNVVVNSPTPLEPYLQINDGTWASQTNAEVCEGGNVSIGPHPYDVEMGWSWTGPNNFTAQVREIQLTNLSANQSGNYVVSLTNELGCTSSSVVAVGINKTPQISIRATSSEPITSTPADFLIETNVVGTDVNTVQFYNGNTLLAEDATAPYTYLWQNILDGSYTLTAQAVSKNQCKAMSSPYTLMVSKITTIEGDNEEKISVICFPNPFQNSFTIKSSGFFEYGIYTLTGILLEEGKGANEITTGETLINGMYILRVRSSAGEYEIKIAK